MRIMITGGGTGGHTSPGVAVIEELRRRDPQLLLQWVGRRGGIEERVAKSLGVPFRAVPVEGWPRTRTLRRAWVAAKLALGILRAATYLRRFRPDIVFGVGGFVCLPLMIAAQRLGYATMIHEQNKRLGMANAMLAPRATRIFLSYEDTVGLGVESPHPTPLPGGEGGGRVRVVGNPVRAGFAMPPAVPEARARFGLDPEIVTVLVVGGSQGAQSLNDAMAEALPSFGAREAQFLWMTGASGVDQAKQVVAQCAAAAQVFPFIEDMVAACAAADLIVARAGASTTAEIALIGRASALVPYPHATDNHQEQNARAFEEAGAAWVLEDVLCTGDALGKIIRDALGDRAELDRRAQAARALAKPMAAEAIVEEMMVHVFQGAGTETIESPYGE